MNDQSPTINTLPLSLVPANRTVVLHRVRGGQGVSKHLAAMGLLPGVRIQVLHNDLRGPVLIGLNDSRLALGRGMAHKISGYEDSPEGMTGKGATTYSGKGK